MNSRFTAFEISAAINSMKKKLVVRMIFQQKLYSLHWESSYPFLSVSLNYMLDIGKFPESWIEGLIFQLHGAVIEKTLVTIDVLQFSLLWESSLKL